MSGKLLIAGASGVVGTSAVEAFSKAGWEVIALSRRKPETSLGARFTHVSLNLFDAEECSAAIGAIDGISHVVFAALSESPGLVEGWFDPAQMNLNLTMLQNCLNPILAKKSPLQHVSIMQGTKAYGQHVHPMEIPARESSPRDPHENFYWLQEDWIKAKSTEYGFNFTIFRPPMIFGSAYGAAMNIMPVLGAYGAICHERGLSFGFPGGPLYVWEAMDSRVLASAFMWATETPQAWGEHFNITNGDVFEWRNAWPVIAEELGLPAAEDTPRLMHTFLPQHAKLWDEIAVKYGLRPVSMSNLLGESHYVADFCFAAGAETAPTPAFMSTVKLRQAGFHDFIDTRESLKYWLSDFVRRKVIPKF